MFNNHNIHFFFITLHLKYRISPLLVCPIQEGIQRLFKFSIKKQKINNKNNNHSNFVDCGCFACWINFGVTVAAGRWFNWWRKANYDISAPTWIIIVPTVHRSALTHTCISGGSHVRRSNKILHFPFSICYVNMKNRAVRFWMDGIFGILFTE